MAEWRLRSLKQVWQRSTLQLSQVWRATLQRLCDCRVWAVQGSVHPEPKLIGRDSGNAHHKFESHALIESCLAPWSKCLRGKCLLVAWTTSGTRASAHLCASFTVACANCNQAPQTLSLRVISSALGRAAWWIKPCVHTFGKYALSACNLESPDMRTVSITPVSTCGLHSSWNLRNRRSSKTKQ